ncbi:MAG TPA: thioesterase family protein [Gammaproteobacteria bacterium]
MPGYRETFRRMVSAEMCDIYGHMNVAYYVAAISDSFFSLMTEVGLGKSAVDRHRVGLVAVNMNIDYTAEVGLGDVIRMQGAIVSAAGKKMTCRFHLYDVSSGKQAMTATVLYVCMDLDSRRSRAIPGHLLEAALAAAVGE